MEVYIIDFLDENDHFQILVKEATARIKINKLLEYPVHCFLLTI